MNLNIYLQNLFENNNWLFYIFNSKDKKDIESVIITVKSIMIKDYPNISDEDILSFVKQYNDCKILK